MQEFVKKLIERLEKILVENTCSDCPYKAKCDEVQEHINDETTDLCGATIKALSIEIVKQLAEEYNNDFCEWKKTDKRKSSPYHHALKHGNITLEFHDDFKICPYCGKKIKVVE